MGDVIEQQRKLLQATDEPLSVPATIEGLIYLSKHVVHIDTDWGDYTPPKAEFEAAIAWLTKLPKLKFLRERWRAAKPPRQRKSTPAGDSNDAPDTSQGAAAGEGGTEH
jgi:hypothetical protein